MHTVKYASIIPLSIFLSFSAIAQNWKEPFVIPVVSQRVSGSLYNEIHFIDAREDSVQMGMVLVGALGHPADVVMEKSFHVQLATLMRELTDTTAEKNILYFQLRKFSFSELSGAYSQKRLFRLQAGLYRQLGDHLIKINSIDTIISARSLLKQAGIEFISFIQQNLRNNGNDSGTYSLAELEHPDSVEKSKINLYTTAQYTDGLYLSYQSFFAQKPDRPIIVEEKKEKIKSVQIVDSTGKLVKVKSKNAYALVYKGHPYAATSYDFYPLIKYQDDFYFTGKVNAMLSVDPMIFFMFGLAGVLMSNTNSDTFDMKIDHHSGYFIRLRFVPGPSSVNSQ